MATDLITQERLKSLLTYDAGTGEFRWLVNRGTRGIAGAKAGHLHDSGYVMIQLDGRKYRAHRLAWVYTHGVWPDEVDHINRDPADNRLANLRSVSHAQNGQNQSRPKNNTSGYIGVDFHKRSQKWRARIRVSGVLRDVGYFDTPEKAARPRELAEAAHLPFRTPNAVTDI